MNPIQNKQNLLNGFISLDRMYPKAYNKNKTGPYTKTRVILLNGTEYESVWFMHQFARHCDIPEVCENLAIVRKQEQQQQKRIACLKPINESILETTISYEQLAIDLTACLARAETDQNNIDALNFALLEDFDHLYRFANLLAIDQGIDVKKLVGEFTEITPGRPTIAEHRFPTQELRNHMDSKKAQLYSKLVAATITAAEQQTMNYYMNISQWYENDLGRRLYSEIALIEEQHVSQYESLKDPTMTWFEQWVLHEYTECYLYYSAMETETDKYIKEIWKEHYDMECAHLKVAVDMLKKYDNKDYKCVVGDGEFPPVLDLCSNKEYVRDVLKRTVTLNAENKKYVDLASLKENSVYFLYQNDVVNEKTTPSHEVIEKAVSTFGTDYRYEDLPNPVPELQDRKKDNICVARKKCN